MTRALLLGALLLVPVLAAAQWPAPKPRDTRLYDAMTEQAAESARWQREQVRQQEAERLQQFRDFERERREERRFRRLRDAIEERPR